MPGIEEHITLQELKACVAPSRRSPPELKGRRLLLHEDNQSVIGVLTHLTSKSPTMTLELRKLFLLTGNYDIKIRTQYIRSASDV